MARASWRRRSYQRRPPADQRIHERRARERLHAVPRRGHLHAASEQRVRHPVVLTQPLEHEPRAEQRAHHRPDPVVPPDLDDLEVRARVGIGAPLLGVDRRPPTADVADLAFQLARLRVLQSSAMEAPMLPASVLERRCPRHRLRGGELAGWPATGRPGEGHAALISERAPRFPGYLACLGSGTLRAISARARACSTLERAGGQPRR